MNDQYKICKQHKSKDVVSKASFCINCGVIISDSVYSIKSVTNNHKLEISPLDYFNCLVKRTQTKNIISNTYLDKRIQIIRNMKFIISKLKFSRKIFFLAINYLDLIHSLNSNPEYKLELIAICCILLSAKFDENDPYFPDPSYFQTAYPKIFFMIEDIQRCEIFCIKTLNYTLNNTTSYNFLKLFVFHGFIFSDDLILNTKSKTNENERKSLTNELLLPKNIEKMANYAQDLLQSLIQDPRIVDLSVFHIACSCIARTREVYKIHKIWPVHLENFFNVSFQNFENCFEVCKRIQETQNVFEGKILSKIPNSLLTKVISTSKNKTMYSNYNESARDKTNVSLKLKIDSKIKTSKDNSLSSRIKDIGFKKLLKSHLSSEFTPHESSKNFVDSDTSNHMDITKKIKKKLDFYKFNKNNDSKNRSREAVKENSLILKKSIFNTRNPKKNFEILNSSSIQKNNNLSQIGIHPNATSLNSSQTINTHRISETRDKIKNRTLIVINENEENTKNIFQLKKIENCKSNGVKTQNTSKNHKSNILRLKKTSLEREKVRINLKPANELVNKVKFERKTIGVIELKNQLKNEGYLKKTSILKKNF